MIPLQAQIGPRSQVFPDVTRRGALSGNLAGVHVASLNKLARALATECYPAFDHWAQPIPTRALGEPSNPGPAYGCYEWGSNI